MAKSAEEVVRNYCALWERQDVEAVVKAMTPDCIYQNVPVPAMHGRDEVRAFISKLLLTASKVEFVVHGLATAADGKTVYTERTDIFSLGDKKMEAPVMGVFVVRDGLIHEWRDYCDIATLVTQMKKLGFTPGTEIPS